jgi:aminoglycoside phosphotransferase (APT) family kinase protein
VTADLPLDGARAVRPGEELDLAKLEPYLAAHLPGFEPPLSVEQFPGGHSNLTYLLSAGPRKLVLRRPPFGTPVKSAHDMGREYRILSRLPAVYPRAPRALLHCEDPAILGAPFFVMERVEGVILRGARPRGVVLDEAAMAKISRATVDGLAELHAVDYRTAGLGELGKPEGYVSRQVSGWIERYQKARTDDVPDMDKVAAWMVSHQPAESGTALIHGDFKYDNLVLDPADLSRIRAVLDWEMATIGDPLLDLGTTLGYWVDPGDSEQARMLPFGPTVLPGNLTRAEVVARYAEKSGRAVPDAVFYYAFASYKIAVIAQQIYWRFKQGLTKDERFAQMIAGVMILAQNAGRAIDVGRIDRLWS